MAEIDIQKKSGPPIWTWVVGALLLLLVIGLIWALTRDDTTRDRGVAPADTVGATWDTAAPTTARNGAVEEYLEFGREAEGPDVDMGQNHEYINQGLQRLVAALEEVIRQDTVGQRALEERLDQVRDRSERITEDPDSPQHANQVREAFREAADLIEHAREQRAPDQPGVAQRADATREAAESIDPGTPLLDQREEVRTFFRESAQALDRLRAAPRR